MQQIITIGGGGLSAGPDGALLERFLLQQTQLERPSVCFLPQASAESRDYVTRFFQTFADLDARPSWVSLYGRVDGGWRDRLLGADLIYVGGGNTRSMLALWREWGVDSVLREAYDSGTVLAGVSAGMICWYEQGVTDSVWPLGVLPCLGFLSGGACPHFDGEIERRPACHQMLEAGELVPGIALDDGAAAHYVDGELHQVVTSRNGAGGYLLSMEGGTVAEQPLPTRFLGAE